MAHEDEPQDPVTGALVLLAHLDGRIRDCRASRDYEAAAAAEGIRDEVLTALRAGLRISVPADMHERYGLDRYGDDGKPLP